MQHIRVPGFVLLAILAAQAFAQDTGSWTYNAVNDYRIVPNVVYSTANNYECKLDAYVRNNPGRTTPTVVYIHGGGWVAGAKETSLM